MSQRRLEKHLIELMLGSTVSVPKRSSFNFVTYKCSNFLVFTPASLSSPRREYCLGLVMRSIICSPAQFCKKKTYVQPESPVENILLHKSKIVSPTSIIKRSIKKISITFFFFLEGKWNISYVIHTINA